MSYPIGTILHGNNKKIGNLWIILRDNSYDAAMLWDGLTQSVAPDSSYKQDRMSDGMQVANAFDVAKILGSWARLPVWANSLILAKAPSGSNLIPVPQVVNPSVIKSIEAAVGPIDRRQKLLDNGVIKSHYESEGLCPARVNDSHVFNLYEGFTDYYDYCIHCDMKRRVTK